MPPAVCDMRISLLAPCLRSAHDQRTEVRFLPSVVQRLTVWPFVTQVESVSSR